VRVGFPPPAHCKIQQIYGPPRNGGGFLALLRLRASDGHSRIKVYENYR